MSRDGAHVEVGALSLLVGDGQARLARRDDPRRRLLNGPNIDTVLDATEPGATGDDGAARTLVVAIAAQVAMVLGATALAVFKPAGRLGGLRRAG